MPASGKSSVHSRFPSLAAFNLCASYGICNLECTAIRKVFNLLTSQIHPLYTVASIKILLLGQNRAPPLGADWKHPPSRPGLQDPRQDLPSQPASEKTLAALASATDDKHRGLRFKPHMSPAWQAHSSPPNAL